jgi:hypothetical protein
MGALGEAVDGRDSWDDLEKHYACVQPNRWTFQSKKVRRWVEERLRGRILNACAGKTKLAHDHAIVRNDIDEDRDADLHVDVCEIADHFDPESFGTIIYDPPYSQNQATRAYELDDGEAVVAGDDAVAKRQFHELLQPGGRVIQFGYTTTCMPASLGYNREAVALWNPLGRSQDFMSTVDEKPGELETEPRWFQSDESDDKCSLSTDSDRS